MKQIKQSHEDINALFVPAGLFVGMGFGFILNQLVGGILIGLGLGILGMAIAKKRK
ncbi:MAG: hypothetical protein NTV63_03805 [Candidatus Woesearchaeota archaeon]|nr:hypothetical protein [Candidatus Woesearchaeota archaeon]